MADTTTNTDAEKPRPLPKRTDAKAYAGRDDEALLKEMHDEFDYAFEAWQNIKAEAEVDMTYVTGNPWTTSDRNARKGRPIVSVDQLQQYINQLVNTVRQNKRSGKVTPEGLGANDETARYVQGRIRQIEYLSHAQEAYTAAFENACERSYGFVRLTADYESPRSPNQRLCIKPVPNPDQCLPGGDWQSTSLADVNDFWYTYTLSKTEFAKQFPTAKVRDFGLELRTAAPRWVQDDRVQVAEWWRRRHVTRTCALIQPEPSLMDRAKAMLARQPVQTPKPVVYIDGVDPPERKPKGKVLQTWTREIPEVCMYRTNGIELLEKEGEPKKTIWKGRFIPFAGCFGKILWTDFGGTGSQRQILSYIRLARDAQKSLNWIESTKLEIMAMQPRTPYFAYRGQLNAKEQNLIKQSLHQPVAVITAAAFSTETGNAVLPLPRRELPDISSIAGYEMAAEAAKRNIQNAVGRYSASVGRADTNVKSGVALKRLDDQSDQGSYHFIDHYDDMILHLWEMMLDLLPFYDDTAKDVTLREPDDSVVMRRINDPSHMGDDGAIDYFDAVNLGEHAITLSTGPSFDSEREQANELAMTLLQNPQAFASIAGDAVRLMNVGPLGDQIAEDLDALQPPELQKRKAAKAQKADPAKMQQQIAALQDQLKHAEQVIQQAAMEQKTDAQKIRLKAESDARVKQIEASKEFALQRMKDATTIRVAFITAAKERGEQLNEAFLEQLALGHEKDMQRLEHEHEARMQANEHAHASGLAALGAQADADAQDSAQAAAAASQQTELDNRPEATS